MVAAHTMLSDWWKAMGHEPAKASPGEAAIQEIERRYRVTLPEDFRNYLLDAAPKDRVKDNHVITWWSPSRITSVSQEYGHTVWSPAVSERAGSFLFFADYMAWYSAWAICCDDSPHRGKVASINAVEDHFVATSFTAFVRPTWPNQPRCFEGVPAQGRKTPMEPG